MCFSEPPSMLIATSEECFDVYPSWDASPGKKHICEGHRQSHDLCFRPVTHAGGNLLGSRDPDNTARVPVLLAIIHRDNSATCNEQPGLCVGAEAMGPVLIWDKDRLLISGPEPLALCLDFRYATNATDRMLRLRRRKTEGTMTLWINRTGVLVSRSQKLIIFTKQRYKRDGGEGDGNKIKSPRPTSYCLSHLNHRCEHLFQSPPALKLFPESSLTL